MIDNSDYADSAEHSYHSCWKVCQLCFTWKVFRASETYDNLSKCVEVSHENQKRDFQLSYSMWKKIRKHTFTLSQFFYLEKAFSVDTLRWSSQWYYMNEHIHESRGTSTLNLSMNSCFFSSISKKQIKWKTSPFWWEIFTWENLSKSWFSCTSFLSLRENKLQKLIYKLFLRPKFVTMISHTIIEISLSESKKQKSMLNDWWNIINSHDSVNFGIKWAFIIYPKRTATD